MSELSLIRHQSIFNATEHRERVTIIGAGATGSRVFMSLVELGLTNISVADYDSVEAHNLANQAFNRDHVGQLKVHGLANLYASKTGYPTPKCMNLFAARIPHNGFQLEGTVFLLTDTMASRKEIYEKCIKGNYNVTRVIETRMASTHGNIYNFDPHTDGEKWAATLIDDGVAELSPCGSPLSVGPTAAIIANMAVWQYILNKTDPGMAASGLDLFLKPAILVEQRQHDTSN
jgi:molybdopterin/thiamine biosynthesis adenylyltransferase